MRGLPLHLISGMLPLSRYSTHQRSICFTGGELLLQEKFLEDYREKPGMFTRPLSLQTCCRALNLRQINLSFMPSLWYLGLQTLVALLLPLYQGEGKADFNRLG